MHSSTIQNLFGLSDDDDSIPFDWNEDWPNCRIYDPAWYEARLEIKKQKGEPDATMYFGKHKGKKFTDIPTGYLNWMVENFTKNKQKKLVDFAKNELERRKMIDQS